LDQLGSAILVGRYAAQHPVLEQPNQKLEARSYTLRRRIAVYVEKRIRRVYPEAARRQPTAVQKGKVDFFSAADLLWLFVIGAFLGDMVETVFCRLTAGVWMSRSSLVWGPFSVVWGLALAMATVLLRQNQDKSDRYLFAFGTVLGGVYEYVCSAVTELLFGTVFWDYSKFKFKSGRAHQPAVLLFLGHCGGDVDALRLPAGAEADEKGAQPYPSVDDSSAGGIHGGEYAYQRAGTGAVRCPHQRRCAQRPAGSVP
jgi:hypothetical protein